MFRRKKKAKQFLNRKGFSLVEILIAVAVLMVIAVPLAMNMISSSQINSKSKQVAASSDVTDSLMEVMQTVDLSDIMTEVNGYATGEYGSEVTYLIREDALSSYLIGDTAELIKQEDGTYEFVTKSGALNEDFDSNASVITRSTGDVIRAYFRGQDPDENGDRNYAFLLRGVENDEMKVDVLATIKSEADFDIVNITSMDQTEVVYARQKENMDETIANEYLAYNSEYMALKADTEAGVLKDTTYFKENMKREITVDIVQNAFSEAVTIEIYATYTMDPQSPEGRMFPDSDSVIKKKLGEFTTNSTAEFARGVYVYYYPLMNQGTARDSFVIKNENELNVPVYFIAMADDAAFDVTNLTNYNPILKIHELSNTVYQAARTTVCSNIPKDLWDVTITPNKPQPFSVKSLGNLTNQQTLYSVNFQVYRYKNESVGENANGKKAYVPNEKDLLAETTGTFIDTSEILDVKSDKTTGLTPVPGIATAGKYSLIYSGTQQEGVYGDNVNWTGVTHATNAGTYTAYATPIPGFAWADGSNVEKKITWTIERAPSATAREVSQVYQKQLLRGVAGDFIELSGTYEATNAGYYTAYAKPDANHAWEDGTYSTKSIKWSIYQRPVQILWDTGDGYDTWKYDGLEHSGSCKLSNVIAGDTCEAIFKDNVIRNVGTKLASVIGLTNPNYALPEFNTTHVLTVITENAAAVNLVNGGVLEYNGETQSIVRSSRGVYFVGDVQARDAGDYVLTAILEDGYTWPDGTTDSKLIQWKILPRTAILVWGELTWTYNGLSHQTTCYVSNICPGDVCTVELEGNYIKDAGRTTVVVKSLSNPNYVLPDTGLEQTLEVLRAKLAYFQQFNHDYDGEPKLGVVGQYINVTGQYKETNVAMTPDGENITYYVANVEPVPNYAWQDGTYDRKEVKWYIYPIKDVWVQVFNLNYIGEKIRGVYFEEEGDPAVPTKLTVKSGKYEETNPGVYQVTLKPIANHAWDDSMGPEFEGKFGTRTFQWSILANDITKPRLQTILPDSDTHIDKKLSNGTYDGIPSYEYNGKYQLPVFEIAYTQPLTETKASNGRVTKLECDWYEITAASGSYLDQIHANSGNETYKMKVKLKGFAFWGKDSNGNVDSSELTLEWRIHPKTITPTYTASDNKWEYNRTQRIGHCKPNGVIAQVADGPDGKADTLDGADDTSYTMFEYSNNQKTNAGKYKFKIIGTTDPDYKISKTYEYDMEITKRPITLTWGTSSWVFDAQYHTLKPSIGNVCSGDSVDITMENNKMYHVGTQTAKVTGINNDNYSLPSNLTHSMSITVQKTAKVVTTDRVYNTETQTGVTTKVNVTKVSGDETGKNAATYSATYHPKRDDGHADYAWSDGTTGNKTFQWKISRNKSASYSKSNKTYNGSSQTGVTVNSYATRTGTYSATNAGTYTAYVEPKDNYAWSDGTYAKKTISWEIEKASNPRTQSASGKTYTYDGSSHTMCSAADFKAGTTYYKIGSGGYSTSLPKATNAGSYTISYYSSSTSNYKQSSTYSCTGTINKSKTASVTAYSTFAYTGTSHSAIASKSHCSKSTGTTYAVNVGEYSFTMKADSNYLFPNGSAYDIVHWSIIRNKGASASVSGLSPSWVNAGQTKSVSFVKSGYHVTWSNTTHSVLLGKAQSKTLTCSATPTSNYAWANGSYGKKSFSKSIMGL